MRPAQLPNQPAMKCPLTKSNRLLHPRFPKTGGSGPSGPRPLVGRAAILGDRSSDNFVDVAFGSGDLATSVFVVAESGVVCQLNEERKIAKWVDTKVRLLERANGLVSHGAYTLRAHRREKKEN